LSQRQWGTVPEDYSPNGIAWDSEGNQGEDSKELYYYLDATPTHTYPKMLYKYPQRAFPYTRLVEENRRRSPEREPSAPSISS
jgi:hypothetical protein